MVGSVRVLFASDWPHMDGAWPDPLTILRERPDVDDAQRRAMLTDGPAAFFGLDLARVATVGGWDLDARLDERSTILPGGQ